jgi:heme exporter protein CcmD
MSEALIMGGYGSYVWSCVGLTAIVLVFCAVRAWQRQQKIVHDIRLQLNAMESTE